MKFSIMYLTDTKINGTLDGYRPLPNGAISEDTRKKVEEDIEAYKKEVNNARIEQR